MMSAFAFANPAILFGLIALPIIWWLLRLTPPLNGWISRFSGRVVSGNSPGASGNESWLLERSHRLPTWCYSMNPLLALTCPVKKSSLR